MRRSTAASRAEACEIDPEEGVHGAPEVEAHEAGEPVTGAELGGGAPGGGTASSDEAQPPWASHPKRSRLNARRG